MPEFETHLQFDSLQRDPLLQLEDADLRSIRKICLHIAHPDGEPLLPFDTCNTFYRDDLDQTRLAPLRE